MVRHIQSLGIEEFIQAILMVFKHIQRYWWLAGRQPDEKTRQSGLSCSFLKIKKSVLIFERRAQISHPFRIPAPFHELHPNAYSEPYNTYENLWIFRTLIYFKPGTYSVPFQRLNIELYAKIVKNINSFSKVLHHRSLIGFWIRASLDKYSFLTIMLSISMLDWVYLNNQYMIFI